MFPKIVERQYRQYGRECMCADCKGGKRMEDEFDAFKPTYAPKSFYDWNVEDLKDYQEQLKAEIVRIDKILATKQDVSAQAEALFKP